MSFALKWSRSIRAINNTENSSSNWYSYLFSLSLSVSVPLCFFFAPFVLFICFPLFPYLQGLCHNEWEVLKRIAWPSPLLDTCISWGMSFNRGKKRRCFFFFLVFVLFVLFFNSSTVELPAMVICSKISFRTYLSECSQMRSSWGFPWIIESQKGLG